MNLCPSVQQLSLIFETGLLFSARKTENQYVKYVLFSHSKHVSVCEISTTGLGMIGSGRSSIAAVADLSRAYLQDSGGSTPQAVQAFASLGGWGSHEQNQERDLHKWVNGLHGLNLETFDVQFECQVRCCLFEKKDIYIYVYL